jgi:membrane-associated phospholipid phosphatase
MARRDTPSPDVAIALFAVRVRRPWLDRIATLVNSAGRGGVAWAVAAAGAAGSENGAASGAAAAAVVLGAFAASAGAARTFGRARPFERSRRIQLLGDSPHGPSFPSDQAAAAGAGAYVLSALLPRWTRPVWAAAAVTGGSRVYAGLHFTSDVVAGTALGAFAGTAWKAARVGRSK